MSPNVNSISSLSPPTLAVSPPAGSVSSQRASGGFAASLAEARNASTRSQVSTNIKGGLLKPSTQISGASATLNRGISPSQTVPIKKLSSNNFVAAATVAPAVDGVPVVSAAVSTTIQKFSEGSQSITQPLDSQLPADTPTLSLTSGLGAGSVARDLHPGALALSSQSNLPIALTGQPTAGVAQPAGFFSFTETAASNTLSINPAAPPPGGQNNGGVSQSLPGETALTAIKVAAAPPQSAPDSTHVPGANESVAGRGERTGLKTKPSLPTAETVVTSSRPAAAATDVVAASAGQQTVLSTRSETSNSLPSFLPEQSTHSSAPIPANAIPSPSPLPTLLSAALNAGKQTIAPPDAKLHQGSPAATSLPPLSSDIPLPQAGQSPFSIFFAGPGGASEAAASLVPQALVAAGNSALSHRGEVSATHSSGGPAGTVATGIAQVSSPQNSQNATPGNGSGGAKNQSPHPDVAHAANSAIAPAAITSAQPSPSTPPPLAAITPAQEITALASGNPTAKPDTPLPASGSQTSPETQTEVSLHPAPPGPIQMAQLVHRAEQSEMRIGMSTTAFGSVEVRTVVHANAVGLLIGSEKGDLRTLLANELPGLSTTLQQHSLRLNSVNFMQGFDFSNNGSADGGSQPRSFTPMRTFANSTTPQGAAGDSIEHTIERGQVANAAGRSGNLSILA